MNNLPLASPIVNPAVATNPRDSWPDWTDLDRWVLSSESGDDPADVLPLSAPEPCPSERRYEAACYLVWFRQRNRWCDRCLTECDGHDVPEWIEAARPDVPGDDRLAMPEWIEVQAKAMRLKGSNLADWLAAKLDAIAEECRFLDADSPDEFDARSELWAGWVAANEPAASGAEGGSL